MNRIEMFPGFLTGVNLETDYQPSFKIQLPAEPPFSDESLPI